MSTLSEHSVRQPASPTVRYSLRRSAMNPLRAARRLLVLLLVAGATGCASYTTPGGPVDLEGIQSYDIYERMAREPAATFPARVALVRVQGSGYHSHSSRTYGAGNYVVETSRELMSDDVLEHVSAWAGVRQVAPLGRLLIPAHLDSVDDLRAASASLKTDILIAFTVDTEFRVDDRPVGPMNVVSLGVLRSRDVVVNTTASAILVDVRSGYVFGLAEASASEQKGASLWNTSSAVDQGRVLTEQEAFDRLVKALEKTWGGVVGEYALAAGAASTPN